MKKEINLVNIKTGEKEVIDVKFKNVERFFLFTLIIDVLSIVFLDWWWSIAIQVLTLILHWKNYMSYDDAKDKVMMLVNNGFVPSTNIDADIIRTHFNVPETLLKPASNVETNLQTEIQKEIV